MPNIDGKEEFVPEFDAELYVKAYPDVAALGLDPKYHYEAYGIHMGRHPAPKLEKYHNRLCIEELKAAKTPKELDLLFTRGAVRHEETPRHDELVSVIMPNFNNGEWIRRSINSALSQIGARVEVIVVDDGSTDDSVTIARHIAKDFSNLKVVSLIRNFGCYYARNIAIMNARGHYITLLDSDDIMTPDRIAIQLDAIKKDEKAVASQSRLRRWTKDFERPLNELKYAENSLLWRKDIVNEIGYYDSVRFGGDTEFRMRLQARYGANSIVRIKDEQYFLRTVESSLTSQPGSQAYAIDNGTLKLELSPERKTYAENLAKWHKVASPLRIEFPQFSRPFALGSPAQAASPTLNQRRFGAMASFPPRREALESAVKSILPQVDQLVIYLNNYLDVPEYLIDSKIRVILGNDASGDLRDNGKFYDLPKDDNSYVFTFDDDIIYPPDYTSRLIHSIDMLGRGSVVGLHGVVFPENSVFSELKQRRVSHFRHQHDGHFVDLLGTGTTAWHSSTLKPTLEDFKTKGMCDLWFAALAANRAVPMFSVPREANWLNILKVFESNLYQETRDRPQGYFDVYRRFLAPALNRGTLRLAKETELRNLYSDDVLASAQIKIWGHYDRK